MYAVCKVEKDVQSRRRVLINVLRTLSAFTHTLR